MMDIANGSLAFSHQASQNHSRTGTKVSSLNLTAGKRRHTFNSGGATINFNICSHTFQFIKKAHILIPLSFGFLRRHGGIVARAEDG